MSKLGKPITEAEIDATIKRYDKDHDGQLSKAEFSEMFGDADVCEEETRP